MPVDIPTPEEVQSAFCQILNVSTTKPESVPDIPRTVQGDDWQSVSPGVTYADLPDGRRRFRIEFEVQLEKGYGPEREQVVRRIEELRDALAPLIENRSGQLFFARPRQDNTLGENHQVQFAVAGLFDAPSA